YFAIDMNREQQAYFSTFRPGIHHRDELVAELQKKIEECYDTTETVEALMTEIPASRRSLARRCKSATGLTPFEYLQRTRIEAAKKLLEESDMPVATVMTHAGYNDLKAFRRQFRRNTGMTPTAYREKFYIRRPVELAPVE